MGRGLDALIPMRKEVEKAMESAESDGMEILFDDEDDIDRPVFTNHSRNVSRETLEENIKEEVDSNSAKSDESSTNDEGKNKEGSVKENGIYR